MTFGASMGNRCALLIFFFPRISRGSCGNRISTIKYNTFGIRVIKRYLAEVQWRYQTIFVALN